MTLLAEERITLTQLAQEQGVNVTTTWRWANRGVRGVRLETFNIGGRRWTTRQAFGRFVAAGTAAANPGVAAAPKQSSLQRDAAHAKAEAELAAAGI